MTKSNQTPPDGPSSERGAEPRWLRAGLDLWIEDAQRSGAAADPEALTRRVLSGSAPLPAVERVPWAWPAAAAALLAVGITGTWLSGANAASTPTPALVAADLECGRLDVLRLSEMDRFAPALDRDGGK